MCRELYICFIWAALASQADAVIALNTTADWVAIGYGSQDDYIADQQTGQPEQDLVGQPGYNAFYKAYDHGSTANDITDDMIGFRFRVATDAGPAGYSKYGFIGVDANSDGAVDVFVGGNDSGIQFYSAGDGLNTSPNTTTVENLTDTDTYFGQIVDWSAGSGAGVTDWSTVSTVDPSLNLTDAAPFSQLDPADPNYIDGTTTADLDGGGGEDYFFSFQVSMDTLMKAIYVATDKNLNKSAYTLDLTSPMSFLVATSTQDNSFNQDLVGQDGSTNYNKSDATWSQLGADSDVYTADGTSPVPEFSTYALCCGLVGFGAALLRRRR